MIKLYATTIFFVLIHFCFVDNINAFVAVANFSVHEQSSPVIVHDLVGNDLCTNFYSQISQSLLLKLW